MGSIPALATSRVVTAPLHGVLFPLLRFSSRSRMLADQATVAGPYARFLLGVTAAAMLLQADTLQARISRILA